MIDKYIKSSTSAGGSVVWPEGFSNPGIEELKFLSVTVIGEKGIATSNVDYLEAFSVEIAYAVYGPLPFCRVGFQLSTAQGSTVFEVYDVDDESHLGRRTKGKFLARCVIPGSLLNEGKYILSVNAGIPNVKNLAFADGVLEINIHDRSSSIAAMNVSRAGVIRPRVHWSVEEL